MDARAVPVCNDDGLGRNGMTRSIGKSKVTVRVSPTTLSVTKLQLLIEPTPACLPHDLPERGAADVVEVVDADDGQAGRLTGGVGCLDAGVERGPELDEAEQEEDQQGKEQRELDRGRAVLLPAPRHPPPPSSAGAVQVRGIRAAGDAVADDRRIGP